MVRLETHDLPRRRSRRATITAVVVGLAVVLVILAVAAPAMARPQHRVFLASAKEQPDLARVTLPLYRGTSGRDTVWYVVTDASSRTLALRLGVNYAPRLRAARGTSAVMRVRPNANGTLNFPATVDFRPRRQFVPDPAWYGGA